MTRQERRPYRQLCRIDAVMHAADAEAHKHAKHTFTRLYLGMDIDAQGDALCFCWDGASCLSVITQATARRYCVWMLPAARAIAVLSCLAEHDREGRSR